MSTKTTIVFITNGTVYASVNITMNFLFVCLFFINMRIRLFYFKFLFSIDVFEFRHIRHQNSHLAFGCCDEWTLISESLQTENYLIVHRQVSSLRSFFFCAASRCQLFILSCNRLSCVCVCVWLEMIELIFYWVYFSRHKRSFPYVSNSA